MAYTNAQQRALDRLALQAQLEGTGSSIRTGRAERVLEKGGIDPALAAEEGGYVNALNRMAQKGGVMGKRAKLFGQNLAMKEIDTWEQAATSAGTDDISRAYQNMTNEFVGALGPGVDVSSPAVLDAIRRYTEGRGSDTARYAHGVSGQAAQARSNALLGIATTLDETGTLVESLKMLKDEQDALRRAQYMNLGLSAVGLGTTAALMGSGAGAGTAGAGSTAVPINPASGLPYGMFPV